MKTLQDYGDQTWDRFFDFIYDNREMSDEEVERELREAGIDAKPALERLQRLIAEHKAQNE